MFKEWGFLITEMVGLIVIAALLGLLAGWLIWGWRAERGVTGGPAEAELDRLQTALDDCRARQAEKDARIAELETRAEDPPAHPPAEAPGPLPIGAEMRDRDAGGDGDATAPAVDAQAKPATLDAARDGQPDDLKRIKGIGPKLEILCNELGFFHFDQIAAWTEREVAWVDANLTGFNGRVSRDNWVEQARLLAEGRDTEL